MVSLADKDESYFSRNRKWLSPLIASFILIVAPMVMDLLVVGQGAQAQQGPHLPDWFRVAGSIAGGIGLVLTLIWVYVTETLSAKLISSALTALGYAILISEIIEWLGR